MKNHEVLIIGGGPGGSTAATILAKRGIDVAIIERADYPRFCIGESLLPASMPIFKETGFWEILSSGKYIQKFGARFIDYKTDDEVYFGFAEGWNTEIPMAFEVERAKFDQDILDYACQSGAKLYQPENVLEVMPDAEGVSVRTNKDEYRAQYLIDVTGREAFLGKKMKMRDMNKDLNNVAVFAHYQGVARRPGRDEGDITIGLLPDRAWTWVIPFKGEITSVGVVCSSSLFDGERDLGAYLERRLKSSPSIAKMMEGAERVCEFGTIGNYSHTCHAFYGDRWLLAGDAAMFLDPIFSSGVHMSVSSSKKAAEAIIEMLPKRLSAKDSGIGRLYEDHVRLGAGRFRNLIGLFYEGDFVAQMKKTLVRDNVRKGFTSAVAGDVWDESNFLFERHIL